MYIYLPRCCFLLFWFVIIKAFVSRKMNLVIQKENFGTIVLVFLGYGVRNFVGYMKQNFGLRYIFVIILSIKYIFIFF